MTEGRLTYVGNFGKTDYWMDHHRWRQFWKDYEKEFRKNLANQDKNSVFYAALKKDKEFTLYGKYADNNTDLKDKYVLWQPGATQPPKMVYSSRAEAIQAAYAMASREPGKQFAVCKIVGSAKTNSVTFHSFED